MIKIKSKTIDQALLQEWVDRLVALGLNSSVKMNVTGEFPKGDTFRISVTPVNGYYTQRTHIQNENYDRILAPGSVLEQLAKFDIEAVDARERELLKLSAQGIKLISEARGRGFACVNVEFSDAYIWLEFSTPLKTRNWGFKKSYTPSQAEKETSERLDAEADSAWLI